MSEEIKIKKNRGWIAAALIFLVGLIGTNVYHLLKNPRTQKLYNESENLVGDAASATDSLINSLSLERDKAVNLVDSFEMEVSKWKFELASIRNSSNNTNLSSNERNSLLGEIAGLRRKIAAYAAKANLLDSATRKNLAYELMLNQRADSLKSTTAALNQLNDTLAKVKQNNQNLNTTISKAGKPKYSGLSIYGMDEKKKGDRTTFDASKIEHLGIEYQLIGSNLYKGNTNVELRLRLIGPNGELYTQGGGTIAKARMEDFTFQEDYNYKGSSNAFKYILKPTKKLVKGNYTLSLLENGVETLNKSIALY